MLDESLLVRGPSALWAAFDETIQNDARRQCRNSNAVVTPSSESADAVIRYERVCADWYLLFSLLDEGFLLSRFLRLLTPRTTVTVFGSKNARIHKSSLSW